MHVKKGDEVVVLAGKEKGKKGTILKALPKQNKVIVEGLNMVKKHIKSRRTNEKGTTISISMPIHVSNVARKGEVSVSKPAKKATKTATKKTVTKKTTKAS